MTSRPPAISPASHWAAEWIWVRGPAKPYHCYIYTRRNFELEAPPETATLHVTASDRYVLFVNGAYVGRGPARSDPRRKSYDSHDVARHLVPGRNTVAIRAYHFGTPRGDAGDDTGWGVWSGNSYTVGERAGLWAQLDLTQPDGSSKTIATDSTWRVRPAKAWNRDVGLINRLVGSIEIFDAAADPADWMAPEFNDASWEPAFTVPQREREWFLLEASELPRMRETKTFPTRVVTMGEVIDMGRAGQTDVPELLYQEIHFPLEHAIAVDTDALLRGDAAEAELQGRFARQHGVRTPYVILDFGRQIFGFPRVRLRAAGGAILDMTYGQQLVNGRIPPAQRYGDRYIARDGSQTWEVAEYRQFRYLHITVRSLYDPVWLQSVSVDAYTYPAEPRGAFECSDPLLNQLWQACVDTTYLNMEDTMVHESYRERSVWATGDGSAGFNVVLAAYGGLPLADRFLRMWPLSDRGDGMMKIAYPPDIATRHIHGQFLLQWSTRVREHYEFTGRRWVLEDLYPSVPRQIDWFEPYRDADGLLRELPGWNMVDWTPIDFRGATFITNAFYVEGLEDAAWLADQMDAEADAQRWRAIALEVRNALQRVYWNEDVGLFEDAHFRGGLTGVVSELANAMALRNGVATEAQAERIAQRLADDDPRLAQSTPLTFGYVADGLLRRGFTRAALAMIRRRFRHMLAATDNPTIWELWWPFTGGYPIYDDAGHALREREHRLRPANVRSLAHTGGVLIGYILATRVLGIRPTGPGFSSCTVHPRLGDLEFARGTMPTPSGDLHATCRKADDGVRLTLDVPDGIAVDAVLERARGAPQVLECDGAPVDVGGEEASAATVQVRVASGTHDVVLRGA